MNLENFDYDPKHLAWFISEENLLKASKIKEFMRGNCSQVETHTLCIKEYVRGFREIHILKQILMMSMKRILQI